MPYRSWRSLGKHATAIAFSFAACAVAHALPPTFSKAFSPSTIGPGSVSTLTFTIDNQGGSAPAGNLAFTDTLPAGMTLADPAQVRTDCSNAIVEGADGGTTLTLSNASLGAGSACHVFVEVTASTPGNYDNISGNLTSDQGNSGTASATLTVNSDRPGFSKSFSPAMISVGQVSTLTFTLDNSQNSAQVFNLSFTDFLPAGLVISNPANSVTDCVGTLQATTGGTTIGFYGGFLAANASCTISVDVTPETIGRKDNLTNGLSSSSGSSGMASASLDVRQGVLTKVFTDDPVRPGGSGTLHFMISNFDRANAMTAINFSDDLDATLSGLVATGLPANDVCGSGSQISGSSVLTLTGGHLDPGTSCDFDVTYQVPAGAAGGEYPNTTSSLSFDRGGAAETADPASDTLIVQHYPLLTKTFTDDPAIAGGNVTMEFTLTNTDSANAATAIAFNDVVGQMLAGTTFSALPANGFCGAGSVAIPYNDGLLGMTLIVQNASLPAGGSCTFDVTLQLPADARGGSYTNTTSSVSATVAGSPVTGPAASDSLTVVSAPRLSKSFTDSPVDAGGTATLEFTLQADTNAPGDATAIAFTDDLDAALSGLVAVGLPASDICGSGSQISGTSTLTLSGASLAPGASCTFQVSVQVPAGATPGSYTNTTSQVSASELGMAVTSPAASAVLDVSGLTLSKTFTDDPVVAGGTVTLHFQLDNASTTGDYTGIAFTDNLNSVVSGLTATGLPMTDICGTGSQISLSGSTLVFTGGSVAAGSSCGFDVTLQVPAAAANGEYGNTTSAVSASYGGNSQTLAPAHDTLQISDALYLTKQFTDDPVAPGDTVTLSFTLDNGIAQPTTGISFTDDLDAALSGLVATGLPQNDVCGTGSTLSGTSVITLTGGTLPASGSCTFQVTLQVPASAPVDTQIVNTTSQVTATVGGNAVTGAPASDTLQLDSIEFSKAFASSAGAGQSVDLTFTLRNLSASTSAGSLGFVDDLGAMLAGTVASGLPANDICGSGSSLTGSSSIVLSGAGLAAGASCSFTVTVQIPASATPGSYTNTTTELTDNGLHSAAPASDTLTVEPPPLFDKAFTPGTVGAGVPSTLTFTIDNSASAVQASALAFTDNLPAGMTVATPANASTTCSGGTLTGTAGSGSVSINGAGVAAGASCNVQIDVVTNAAGSFVNTSGDLTSSLGNSGTASDTLTVVPAPGFSKAFNPGTILAGGISTLSFTIDNSSSSQAATGLGFNDAFPSGTTVASPANATNTCGGSFSAAAGTGTVSLAGGSVAAGATCSLQVDVTAGTAGRYPNVSGDLTSSLGNSGPASATLSVYPPPVFSKAFTPASMPSGGTSTLTFTIDNSASPQSATGLDFSDAFPAGLTVADPANASNTCGGTFSATASTGAVSLSGGSVAAGTTCSLQVDVTATAVQSYPNVSGALTSSLGNSGPASATLTVGPPPLPPSQKVPTLDARLLALLALLMATSAGVTLRYRRSRRR